MITQGNEGVRILVGTVLALSAKLIYPLALDASLQPFLTEKLKIPSSSKSTKLLNELKKEFVIEEF